jgi:hypothetical protein
LNNAQLIPGRVLASRQEDGSEHVYALLQGDNGDDQFNGITKLENEKVSFQVYQLSAGCEPWH